MRNVKIAVVESDGTVRDFIVNLLTYCVNRHVLSFEEGQSAWAYFKEHDDVDIIILEVGLPGMNGLDILGRVKELDPEKICVAMSANPEDEVAARNLGADAFLAKPFDMDDLFSVVQSFVAEDNKPSGDITKK